MDKGQARSLGISVLLHGVALGLLAVSVNPAPEQQTPPAAAPLQARAVDEGQVMAEIERLHAEERAEAAAEQRRVDEARRREQEQRAAEQRRQEAERQAAEERRRLAAQEEQRKIAEAQRQERERQAAEQRRREEAQRQEQERQAAEQRRREEAERQRREQEQQRQAEEALRQQMAAEQARLDAEQQRQLNGERAAYAALIADKVGRNWVRPANLDVTGPCQVLVEQLPSGAVVKVQVLKSCGSPVLDRTVEAAVFKASPLPRPENPAVFDREILFTFKPR